MAGFRDTLRRQKKPAPIVLGERTRLDVHAYHTILEASEHDTEAEAVERIDALLANFAVASRNAASYGQSSKKYL